MFDVVPLLISMHYMMQSFIVKIKFKCGTNQPF